MEPVEYDKMYNLESSYWWFQGRKRIVQTLLEKGVPRRPESPALDMGCGTGLMLEDLQKTRPVIGLDFSTLALRYSRKRCDAPLVRADAQSLPFQTGALDLITALDLTEHVPKDNEMIREIVRVLRPGGRVVLTVPAHPFLWSEHDESLHHFRRYTRPALTSLIRNSGLSIERMGSCITFTYPIIVLFRLLQRLLRKPGKPKTHLIILPAWANRLLLWTVHLEAFLIRWFDLPFGVTLYAVARKKSEHRT